MENEQYFEARDGDATVGGGDAASNLAAVSAASAPGTAPSTSNAAASPPAAGPTVDVGVVAALIQQLGMAAQPAPTPRFKLPEYSGDSDVECFIDTFLGMMEVSQWQPQVALLHLRSCLKGEARDSAAGQNVVQALHSLRSRFGLTASQARDRLAMLRHDGKQSLHALGVEVERLVGVAYQTMPPEHQTILAVEAFKRALDNKALQRHLLAVPASTIPQLVVAAEAYLQVGSVSAFPSRLRPQVAAVSGFSTEAIETPADDELASLLKQLIKTVDSNSKAIAQLSNRQAPPTQTNTMNTSQGGGYRGQPGPCFRCGGPHLKKDCQKPAGNADRPQQ